MDIKKFIFAVLVVLTVVGCGIEWFPENSSNTTPPNTFTFINRCGVPISTVFTSDPITVSGLTGQAQISISTNDNSKYSIDGGGFTNTVGLVTNGQTVRVQHTTAASAGVGATNTIIITTLTIGGQSGTFKTDTNPCLSGSTFPN